MVGGRIVELTCSSTEDAESDESVECLRFLSVRVLVPVSNSKALLEARAERGLAAPPASGLPAFGSPRLSNLTQALAATPAGGLPALGSPLVSGLAAG